MTSEDIHILRKEFFSQPCTSLAPALLGQLLCRKLPSGIILRAEVTSSIMKIGEVLQLKFPRLLRQEHTLTNNWFKKMNSQISSDCGDGGVSSWLPKGSKSNTWTWINVHLLDLWGDWALSALAS